MQLDLIHKNISKHITLEADELDYFASLLRPKTLKKKDVLITPGEICRFESFVNKGCLRTVHTDENGVEHILMFAIEDWWTADLYSFLTQTPATLHIDALEDCELLQIEKDDLEKLYTRVPKFERFFRIMMQNAYIAQQQRIMQNLSFTAEERYQQFQKKYPTLGQRIAQKQIAAFLGITPEFLSTLRKRKL